MGNKILHRFVIFTFVSLYLLVSIISTIHVIDFFQLSNPYWLAVSLAIGFELGAAASLASLVILNKMNKTLVWALFIAITLMQVQGNMYYAFSHMQDFRGWSELFNLVDEDILYQKRILSAVSGAILPLVALGFIKSLVDYIKPDEGKIPSTPLEKSEISESPEIDPVPVEKKIISPEVVSTVSDSQKKSTQEKNPPVDDQPPVYEEKIEENPTPEEIPSPLNEEEIGFILDGTGSNKPKSSSIVSGYFGDIEIDNPDPRGISVEESTILPVNSNKRGGISDPSGKVQINPTILR
jgi:hypothetical protein